MQLTVSVNKFKQIPVRLQVSAVFDSILLLMVIKRTQFVFSCLPEVKLFEKNLDSSVENEVICNKRAILFICLGGFCLF